MSKRAKVASPPAPRRYSLCRTFQSETRVPHWARARGPGHGVRVTLLFILSLPALAADPFKAHVREARLGLWAAPNPLPPWEWHKAGHPRHSQLHVGQRRVRNVGLTADRSPTLTQRA